MKRYPSCTKFYNFLRSNKLAPLSIKIKVLESCVVSSLLHNCETFGDYYPKDLDKLYLNMIKVLLNVRPSTPNDIVLIESGLQPLKARIYARQLKFYMRFMNVIDEYGNRKKVMDTLLLNPTSYLQHYVNLNNKYDTPKRIYEHFNYELKESISSKANDDHYKFKTYMEINPNLLPSPFLKHYNPIVNDIIKFRLGSHHLPIETGRWLRIPRIERLCRFCGVVGDEKHLLFNCTVINRNDLNMQCSLDNIWFHDSIFELFENLKQSEFL